MSLPRHGTCGAARHLRSLTPGDLRSHGPAPVHRAQKNNQDSSREKGESRPHDPRSTFT